MADLCENIKSGAQNVGDGLRFASFAPLPTKMFTVCQRNESFKPCKKIASIVAHNDCVLSDKYSCSAIYDAIILSELIYVLNWKSKQSKNIPHISSQAPSFNSYCISFALSDNVSISDCLIWYSRLLNFALTILPKNESILILQHMGSSLAGNLFYGALYLQILLNASLFAI